MPSKFTKPSVVEETFAVYSDPHVHDLADFVAREVFGATRGAAGYRHHVTLFLLDIEARIHGNRRAVERANRDPKLWERKRAVALDSGRLELLATPPSDQVVRKWRDQFLPRTQVSKEHSELPAVLRSFLSRYTELAVQRAQELGNLLPGKQPDFTKARRKRAVIADGTYIDPFSHAQVWTDEDGVQHQLHSRAKSPQRAVVQDVVHSAKKAGRQHMGVNHVCAVTETKYGRVHVGMARALSGEPRAVAAVMDEVMRFANGGVHTLLYDKGLNTWPQHYLLAKYGILSIAPITRHTSSDKETTQVTQDVKTALKRAQATSKKKATKVQITALRDMEMNDRYKVEELIKLHKQGKAIGAGLRVGQSQYVNSNNNIEQYQTRSYQHAPATHTLADGTQCAHDLWVDHGGLWDTTHTSHGHIKTQRVRCTSARPVHNGSQYELRTEHELTCATTGEVVKVPTIAFAPDPSRKSSKPISKMDPRKQAAAVLRPIAECDPTWRPAYGRRNQIESWFSFAKGRLLEHQRAASLDVNHQFLDFLYIGLITNALALRQYRMRGATPTQRM